MEERYAAQKMVAPEKDPYPNLIGDWLEIDIQGNGHRWGVYRGKNTVGDLVLQPSVIQEGAPIEPEKPFGERRSVLLLMDNPMYISHAHVTCVSFAREEFIRRRVRETSYPSLEDFSI